MTREEAIKIVKEFINGTCLHLVDQEALETLIPELAESEDEKIRKHLIEVVELYWGKTNEPGKAEDLAWLEKQKENPDRLTIVEKAKSEKQVVLLTESKGDENIYWDTKSEEDAVSLLEKGLKFFGKHKEKQKEQKSITDSVEFEEGYKTGYEVGLDEGIHKNLPKEIDSQVWQIANNAAMKWEEGFAVLIAAKNAFEKGKREALKEQKPVCGGNFKWTSQDERCRSKLIDVLELADAAYPTTKDSRDELWEWLKELPIKFPNKNAFIAGTLDNDDEWSQTEEILGPDGNPTCYKQKSVDASASTMIPSCWETEQKPAEQIHFDFSGEIPVPTDAFRFNLESCLYNFGKLIASECLNTHILDDELNEYVTEEKVRKHLEQYMNCLCMYHPLQKPAEWSEEDEKRLKQLIYDTEHIRAEYEKGNEKIGEEFNNALIEDCDEQIAWLKNLPSRFSLQQKQELSEEEIGHLYTLASYIKSKGYEDDGEFLEGVANKLKSLRPQPKVEWNEEDEKVIERLRSIVNECAFKNDALDVNGDYCEGDYAELDSWLISLRPKKLDASKLENFDPVDVLHRIKTEWPMAWEKVAPKQEWSEEDERLRQVAIRACEQTIQDYPNDSVRFKECVSWLKSLKNRGNSPKSNTNSPNEWSEEDERVLQLIEDVIRVYGKTQGEWIGGYDMDSLIFHLRKIKSFRPQPSWKPSKEQLEALGIAMDRNDSIGYNLRQLYEQFKKL